MCDYKEVTICLELFYILIVVVVTRIYAYTKIHRTIDQNKVNIKKIHGRWPNLGMHACNLSYSGGGSQEE
jgi:hypothetical protein